MMPSCSHTGTPRHFHSSTTSGAACLISIRTRASVSPRQSPSSLILASISREGESSAFPCVEPLFVFFMMVVAFVMVVVSRRIRSHSFAGRLARLGHLRGALPGGGLLCDLRRRPGRPSGNDEERLDRGFSH